MRALVALVVVASVPSTAHATNCTPGFLLTAITSTNSASRLQIAVAAGRNWDTPPANWPRTETWSTVRDRVIDELAECTTPLLTDADMTYDSAARDAWKLYEETVKEAVRAAQPTTPVLAPLLGPGGAPEPQYVQLGLSQLVTAGQPALAATLAGNFGRAQQSSISVSTIVVQPTQTDDPAAVGPPSPQVASFDAGIYYTTRPNVHTFIAWVTGDNDAVSVALGERAWAATVLFVTRLKTNLPNGSSAQARQGAVADAVAFAGESYRTATRAYIKDHYVDVEEARNRANYLDLAIRLRGTRRAEFLPELPDLLSLSATATGALASQPHDRRPSFGVVGTLSLAASTLPSEQYTQWDTDAVLDTFGFVGDLALGATAAFPSGSDRPPARLVAAAVGRVSWHPVDMGDSTLLSAGGSLVLNVPLGGGIELVGSYTFRRLESGDWISTSGFTVAKSIAE